MRALRSQHGQTGPEYVGLLLIVALIVSLLAAGPAQAIAGHVVAQVRCIASGGGDDCAAGTSPPTAPAPARPGDYPAEGPPIDGRPITVLPFPGSVAGEPVGAEASNGRIGVKAVVTGSARRGREVLDARGCLTIPLSVTVDMRLTGKLSAGSPTAGGSLEAFVGRSSTYLVNASPEQAAAMQDGADAPNPVDPRTLAVGGGIVLTEETYVGWGMAAQYRGLVLSSGHREGDRVAAGVTRLSASAVRVYVGEQAFVEQATRTGLGIPGLSIGLGTTSEEAAGKLRRIDLDISTPGGWNAYQAFIGSGKLPAGDASGVADSANVDQRLWSSRSEIAAQVGPVSASMLMSDAAGVYSRSRHADGSETDSLSSRVDDVTLLSETRTDAGGASTTSYGLLLHDVDPRSLALYDAYHGEPNSAAEGSATNARIDYTAADLHEIQQHVHEAIAFANQDEVGGVLDDATPAEVEAYFKQLGDTEPAGSLDYGSVANQGWLEKIARADHPEDVLLAIAQASQGNPDGALAFLNHISGAVADARGEPVSAENGTPGALQRLDGSDCR